MLVQCQVCHPLLEFPIFILQLLEAAQFGYTHTREFLFTALKRGLDDLHLTADLNHGHAAFYLSQGKGDLLFGEAFSFNDRAPYRPQNSTHSLAIQLVQLSG